MTLQLLDDVDFGDLQPLDEVDFGGNPEDPTGIPDTPYSVLEQMSKEDRKEYTKYINQSRRDLGKKAYRDVWAEKAAGEEPGWASRATTQAAYGLGTTLSTMLLRAAGNSAEADTMERSMGGLRDYVSEYDDTAIKRWGTGALESLSKATVGALGGFPGISAMFAGDAISQGWVEGKDAGLSDEKALTYAVVQGGAEVAFMAAFQALGLGGMEKVLLRSGAWKGIQNMVKDIGWELAEEELTSATQYINGKIMGADKTDWSLEQFGRIAWDTFGQTFLMTAGAHGVASVNEFAENPSRKNAEKVGIPPEHARTKKQREELAATIEEGKAEVVKEMEAGLEAVKAEAPEGNVVADTGVAVTPDMPTMEADTGVGADPTTQVQFGVREGPENVVADTEQAPPVQEQPAPELPPEPEATPEPEQTQEPPTPEATQPEGVATANAVMGRIRESLGLKELGSAAEEGFQEWLDEADAKGFKEYGPARDLASDVIASPREMTPVENAGVALRVAALLERQRSLQESNAEPDVRAQEALRVQDEVDLLSEATRLAGTPTARSLVSRKLLVSLNYELLPWQAANKKGAPLTEEESRYYENAQKEHLKIKDALEKEVEKWENEYAELVAYRLGDVTSETQEQLADKLSALIERGCAL